jgi:hypothetical protein
VDHGRRVSAMALPIEEGRDSQQGFALLIICPAARQTRLSNAGRRAAPRSCDCPQDGPNRTQGRRPSTGG